LCTVRRRLTANRGVVAEALKAPVRGIPGRYAATAAAATGGRQDVFAPQDQSVTCRCADDLCETRALGCCAVQSRRRASSVTLRPIARDRAY